MAGKNVRKSASYKRNRLRAMVRDDFACQHPGCSERCLTRLTVHHIRPLSAGGG